MQSQQVLLLRQCLDMTQQQFSQFVGVGSGTVSRWENFERLETIPLDPFHRQLLEAMYELYRKTPRTEWLDRCHDVRNNLVLHGNLYALYTMLGFIFEKDDISHG